MAAWLHSGFARTSVRLALRYMKANRLRSLLSATGVMLGVASVVVILAVAEGTRREIEERFASLGTETILVERRGLSPEEHSVAARLHVRGVVESEVRELSRVHPELELAAGEREFEAEVVERGYRGSRRVLAATADVFRVRSIAVVRGGAFDEKDYAGRRMVALLSESLWRRLGAPPLERIRSGGLRVGGQIVEPIGVFRSLAIPAASGAAAEAAMPDLLVPLNVAGYLGAPVGGALEPSLTRAVLRVRKGENVLGVADRIEATLLEWHRGVRDFSVVSPLRLIRERQRANRSFNVMMLLLSLVSLAVGGIGIMNIMLASISERRREIGIHRAVGAKRRQIVYLFLVESAALSVLGGLLGIAVGVLASVVAGLTGIRFGLTLAGPVAAIVTAVTVGILSGLYPAIRASWMEPTEAMRV